MSPRTENKAVATPVAAAEEVVEAAVSVGGVLLQPSEVMLDTRPVIEGSASAAAALSIAALNFSTSTRRPLVEVRVTVPAVAAAVSVYVCLVLNFTAYM